MKVCSAEKLVMENLLTSLELVMSCTFTVSQSHGHRLLALICCETQLYHKTRELWLVQAMLLIT